MMSSNKKSNSNKHRIWVAHLFKLRLVRDSNRRRSNKRMRSRKKKKRREKKTNNSLNKDQTIVNLKTKRKFNMLISNRTTKSMKQINKNLFMIITMRKSNLNKNKKYNRKIKRNSKSNKKRHQKGKEKKI